MKKLLSTLFALAFAMMFGLVHVASAMKHEAPAAKKEMKEEMMMKDGMTDAKKEMKDGMKGATPAAPAK